MGAWALALQMVAGQVLVVYLFVAAVGLVLGRGPDRARRFVGDGARAALSFMVPATILRMLVVRDWKEIGAFATVLAVRIVLKNLFIWERGRLRIETESLLRARD